MTAGLLLAAGESTRMGQSKPLLDWGGEVLVVYQVRQLLDAGLERIVVVLGDRAETVAAALARMAAPDAVSVSPSFRTTSESWLMISCRVIRRNWKC